MFIVYLGLGIVLLIAVIYIGLQLSKSIHHGVLQTFFWVLYLATVLTWINIVASVIFYNVLRHKRGPPGVQGPIGEEGNRGKSGICDAGCKNKVCHIRITTELNKHYLDQLKTLIPDFKEKPTIQNREFLEIIRKSCHSEAFTEISKVRKPDQIISYMSSIFRDWLTLVLKMDSNSNKKKIRTYLETDGLEEAPLLGRSRINPMNELEKYDIYHWGKDRIFHPLVIQYCADPVVYQQMPQKSPPRLKAIRTNMYQLVYSNRTSTGHQPVSFYRSDTYNFKGTRYYPLGDVIHQGYPVKSGSKYVERYGVPEKENERTTFHGVTSSGPHKPNLLVFGPEKYVQPPRNWTRIWRNRIGPRITIWKPDDFYDHKYKKWFRGLGYLVVKNWGPNPRYQYGHHTPERQPIRMLAEDLLVNVSDKGLVKLWDDRGSRSPIDVSVWSPKDSQFLGNQNTGLVRRGWNSPGREKIYRVSNDTFFPKDPKPIKFKNDATDEKDLGMGYHGTPHRDPKYSVFTWLQMPIEVQLSSLGTGRKIFLTHSGINTLNSYMIRRLKEGKDKLEGAFGVDPTNYYVSDNFKYNPQKKYQRWEIECVDQNYNPDSKCNNYMYLIKTPYRKKKGKPLYLKVEMDKTGLGKPHFRLDVLPNKNAPYYKALMAEFIWFNPKSATGNRLLMEKLDNGPNKEELEKKWQEYKN